MISMQKIQGNTGVAVQYHDKAFYQDGSIRADNYYASEKSGAIWQGKGAEILRIDGKEVRREDFAAALDGKLLNPATGEIQDLANNARGDARRNGYDLTVAPPKSVSIAALALGDQRVVDAHIKANEAAMKWLEEYAAVARVKESGQALKVNTGNLLWATVLHETNRESEPQLHSHNVVMAVTYDEAAGKWRSLTNDEIYKLRATADRVYLNHLASNLNEIGYKLDFNKHSFEISGMSREQIEGFSSRRLAAEEKLREWGIDPANADYKQRQDAVLATRAVKTEYPREVVEAYWKEKAAELGLDRETIVPEAQHRLGDPVVLYRGSKQGQEMNASVGLFMTTDINVAQRYAGESGSVIERSISFNKLLAAGNLSEAKVFLGLDQKAPLNALVETARSHGYDGITFNSKDGREYVVLEENNGVAAGQRSEVITVRPSVDQLKRKASEAVGWAISHLAEREQAFERREILHSALQFVQGQYIEVSALENAVAGYIERRELVVKEGSELLTTPKALSDEKTLIGVIKSGKDQGNTVLKSLSEFESELKAFESQKSAEFGAEFKLTQEQVAAARNILLHPDSVQGVQGDAGTGKTVGLEFAKNVAESRGWEVLGMATSAKASAALGHGSGIKSETIAMFAQRNSEAINKVKEELADLKVALTEKGYLAEGMVPRIEQTKLQLSDGDKANWYTFDHLRGDVYKSPNNLRNQIGYVLKDLGDRQIPYGKDLLSRLRETGQDGIGKLSEKLITYESVALAESVEAKAALITLDPERNSMLAAYRSKLAELKNLETMGNAKGKPMLMVMDEASLTGVNDTAKVAAFGSKYGARIVFQGDTKQHGSVAAGRAFWQAQQAGMNTSALVETRRFDKATTQVKSGLELVGQRRFAAAISALNRVEVDQSRFVEQIGKSYAESYRALAEGKAVEPEIGVVVLTNRDRKEINFKVHAERQALGVVSKEEFKRDHLDDPKLTQAEKRFVGALNERGVTVFEFTKAYRECGIRKGDVLHLVSFDHERNLVKAETEAGKAIVFNPKVQDFFRALTMENRQFSAGDIIEARANIQGSDGKIAVANGTVGRIKGINEAEMVVEWRPASGIFEMPLDNKKAMNVDHAYAHTTFAEQGSTTQLEIFAISETGARIVNQESTYVGMSRAKGDTLLITSDFDAVMRNVGKSPEKTVAIDVEQSVAKAPELGISIPEPRRGISLR